MTTRQLSVFLENKTGALDEVLAVLKEHQINIIALTLADSRDYGLVRMILSNPQKAENKLREAKLVVRIHEILTIEMPPAPGSLYAIVALFTQAGIAIEYLYAFSFGTKSILVIRTDDKEKSNAVIRNNSLAIIQEEELQK